MNQIPSPCTNVCVLYRNICTGCHRTLNEIAMWSMMSDKQKQEVWSRLKKESKNVE